MLLINILDSLTAPCMVYDKSMYTVFGWCGQYGRHVFIHWPVRPVLLVHGLYGPFPHCRTAYTHTQLNSTQRASMDAGVHIYL